MANINNIDAVNYVISATDTSQAAVDSALSGVKKLGSGVDSFEARVKSQFEKIKSHWMGISASIYAAYQTLSKAWDLMERAAQFEQSKAAFHSMVVSMGADADRLFNELKEKSGGLIDNKALVESANRAMSLGIPLSKLGDLMEIARAKARDMGISATQAFNDIATGVGRASPLILDNLGLVMKVESANQRMAADLGKTVEQLTDKEKKLAVLNATLEAGREALSRYNMSQLTTKEKMEKLMATVNNLQLVMGTVLLRAFGIAMGALQGFAAACMTVVYGVFKIGEAFTWVMSKLPGPHQSEWKASFDNMKILSEAAWKTATDLAQKGQDNIVSAFTKSADLASAMKQKLPGTEEAGLDTAKLDKIKSLNEQIRAQTAKSELDERQHIQWQANEWRKAGADKILIQKWTNAEIAKLDEKQAKETIGKIEKAAKEWQKKEEESAIAQARSNERLLKSRLDYEQKIDDYQKRSGAITDEEYTERKFDRERQIYQQQVQTLNVQLQQADTEARRIELAAQLEEIRLKIVESYEYESFELDVLKMQHEDEVVKAEEKILDLKRQQTQQVWDSMMATNNLIGGDAGKYLGLAQTGVMGMMGGDDEQYALQQEEMNKVYGDKLLALMAQGDAELEIQNTIADQRKSSETLMHARSIAGYKTYANTIMGIMGAILTFAGANNKAMFYLQQAYAMVMTIINTAEGVSAAIALGPPGLPFVPIIEAIGAAQFAIIASQTFDGPKNAGASGSAYSGAGYSYKDPDEPTWGSTSHEKQWAPTINVYFMGTVVDHDKFAREMVPPITKAIRDGVE